MKKFFRGLAMSTGMFSVLPLSFNIWDDGCMNLVVPLSPVVGFFIGLLWYALSILIRFFNLPNLIQAAFIMLIPFVLSGFLHVDGFMDTSDAIFSRRSMEEKRRILKDPAVGAFAVITLAVLFVINYSTVGTILSKNASFVPFIFIPVVSRSVSGISLLNLRLISESGFGAVFKKNTTPLHTVFLVLIILTSIITAFFSGGTNALIAVSTTIAAASLTTAYVYRKLDGISGDLCGCIITVGEICGLLSMALTTLTI